MSQCCAILLSIVRVCHLVSHHYQCLQADLRVVVSHPALQGEDVLGHDRSVDMSYSYHHYLGTSQVMDSQVVHRVLRQYKCGTAELESCI